MGRWYDIKIGDGQNGVQYSSPDGDYNGALNIELDITTTYQDLGQKGSWVRIWGIPKEQLGPQYSLYNKPMTVSAGMSKGLPLAKQQQRGKILDAKVYNALGNWIGTDMTLDVMCLPGQTAPEGAGPNPTPNVNNIVINAPKDKKLEEAIRQALKAAYPDNKIGSIKISDKLKPVQDQIGYHGNLEQFGVFIRRLSQDIINAPDYFGVGITLDNGIFNVFDNSSPQQSQGQIAFEDLIGQPTWLKPNIIQFKTVMRADIHCNDTVKLPPGPVTYTSGVVQSTNQKTLFKGSFVVQQVRHVGNFRQPDAASWVTIFDAYSSSQSS